jgi:hypothetical protein
MPADTDETIPVLVHLNPADWKAFKKLAGNYKASRRLRMMIRSEIRAARAVARSKR